MKDKKILRQQHIDSDFQTQNGGDIFVFDYNII